MDCAGSYPTTIDGNKYYIIATDFFSKFVVVQAVPDITADTTIRFLMERIVSIFGVISKLLTDRGSNFTSDVFEEFCRDWNTEHITTTPYAPWTDGRVEKAVGVAKGHRTPHTTEEFRLIPLLLEGILRLRRSTPLE